MIYRPLGQTEIEVSAICLGTMTWGEQNTEAEAHQQLDFALDHGVNFIDTAEMYPVPPRAETQGLTERYIGSWLRRTGKRDRVILATKVSGRSSELHYLRGGRVCLDRKNIEQAVNASLARLQTDYVDLYQVHWPDRSTNYFGQLGFTPPAREDAVPIAETLGVLGDLVQAGKIRHVGVSNETPWGVMEYLRIGAERGLPRVVSIQNPYSLLNRSFEIGLAEIAWREEVGLLAYSPLAFGVLTGKYLGGARPPGARLTRFERFRRYSNPQSERATARYVEIARRHALDPAQMALAFVLSRPFVTAAIIGATDLEQLATDLGSVHLNLPESVLAEIEAVHQDQPNPAP